MEEPNPNLGRLIPFWYSNLEFNMFTYKWCRITYVKVTTIMMRGWKALCLVAQK